MPGMLSIFKHQLVSLKIDFLNMRSYGDTNPLSQSFAYLLTELPVLKYLAFSGSDDISLITHLDPAIINTTVVSLTLSISDYGRCVSLLSRFEKLTVLTVNFHFQNQKKRVAPRDSTSYYQNQIDERLSVDYCCRLRHVKIYQFNMILENVELLFQLIISPSLLTLCLFNCQRPFTRYPQPKRQPPFLGSTKWHDLVKKYLPSTMERFYIEYEDVDNTMSMTNLVRVKNQFMKYSEQNLPWKVSCSYDQKTELLSFDFNYEKGVRCVGVE